MRTIDPARMSQADRLAELGEILAAGFQRFAAAKFKPSSTPRNSADHLDDLAVGEAPCGSPMELPA